MDRGDLLLYLSIEIVYYVAYQCHIFLHKYDQLFVSDTKPACFQKSLIWRYGLELLYLSKGSTGNHGGYERYFICHELVVALKSYQNAIKTSLNI